MRVGRSCAVVGLVLASLGLATGAAWASSTSWSATNQSNASGSAEYVGSFKWHSSGDNHGGFEIKGTLLDHSRNSRGNKFQVKVEGYSPRVYNAGTDANLTIPDQVHYTSDQLYVVNAYIQTCQRNVLADDCSSWRHYVNPYS